MKFRFRGEGEKSIRFIVEDKDPVNGDTWNFDFMRNYDSRFTRSLFLRRYQRGFKSFLEHIRQKARREGRDQTIAAIGAGWISFKQCKEETKNAKELKKGKKK